MSIVAVNFSSRVIVGALRKTVQMSNKNLLKKIRRTRVQNTIRRESSSYYYFYRMVFVEHPYYYYHIVLLKRCSGSVRR